MNRENSAQYRMRKVKRLSFTASNNKSELRRWMRLLKHYT